MDRQEYDRVYYRAHETKRKAQVKAHRFTHQAEHRTYNQRYYQRHKTEVLQSIKAHNQEIRLRVLIYYGNGKLACVRCGFTDERALSIDHIEGGGTQHYNEIPGRNIYRWLRRQGYPEGYQTLCMNCQWIKRKGE